MTCSESRLHGVRSDEDASNVCGADLSDHDGQSGLDRADTGTGEQFGTRPLV
jgi:hypothetical protein